MKNKQIPLEFRRHDLRRDLETQKLVCSACGWSWKTPPQSDCPGVKRYEYADLPSTLAHKTALRERHLRPGGPPRGVFFRSGQGAKPTRWCPLYAVSEAVPTTTKGASDAPGQG